MTVTALIFTLGCVKDPDQTKCPEQVPVGHIANSGHRGGADAFTKMPDNAIETVKAFLKCAVDRTDFKYLEFDIREYKGELVVSHDPRTDDRASLLSDYLEAIKDSQVPVVMEIKSLLTDVNRDRLIEYAKDMSGPVERYHSTFDFPKRRVNLMAFGWAFKASFPDKDKWCGKIKEAGFEGLWTPKTHRVNNCK